MTGMLISAFALLTAAGAGLVCEMQRIHHFQRAVANMRLGRTLSTQTSLTTSNRYRQARNLLTAAALAAVVMFLASGMLS